MSAAAPDFTQAERFLTLLDAEATRFTFQTFDDDAEREDRRLIRIIHGSLKDKFAQLASLNAAGAGIFVTVNATDFRGRQTKNIVGIRAFFTDSDGAPKPENFLPPTIEVESSPGRWHTYWRVSDVTLEAFTGKQQGLIERFGSDPKVHDLPRVMRLPGFYHRKREPYLVRITAANPDAVYTADQFPDAPPEPYREPSPAGRRSVDPGRLGAYGEAALEKLCAELAGTPKGSRNDAANRIAFRAGRLAAGGCFTRSEAYAALAAACRSWGIKPRDRVFGRKGTLARALRDGTASPAGPADRLAGDSDPDIDAFLNNRPRPPAEAEGPPPDPGISIDDADAALAAYFAALAKRIVDWLKDPVGLPPRSALMTTTGLGKSEQIRLLAAAIARATRKRVIIFVPTHKLADEARRKMPSGVKVVVWQGRDSDKVNTTTPMCVNMVAVNAALAIGASVESTVCRNGAVRCPFLEDCEYQKQKLAVRKADVIFAAHELLFQLPEVLKKNIALSIVDESFWQDGLDGIKRLRRLAIEGLGSDLQRFPVLGGKGLVPKPDLVETGRLGDLIAALQCALAGREDGYVERQWLDAHLLPADRYERGSCEDARKLEEARYVDPGIHPGSSAADRKRAVREYAFLGLLDRRMAMWKILSDLLNGSEAATGRLMIETVASKAGEVRCLRMLERKEIDPVLTGLPLVVADATLPIEIVRYFLPGIPLDLDLDVAAPHQRIVQVTGLPVGKSSLQPLPPGKRHPEQEARVGRKRSRIAAVIEHLAQGRRTLVVTYKNIENDFAAIPGVETAHFNAVEGRDEWRDVELLIVIGRPLPRPEELVLTAAAVTGKPVVARPTIARPQRARLASGAPHPLAGGINGDPSVAMIQRAVTESAVLQTEGRPRGIRRTAANPVEIYVLNDVVVTGQRVDEVIEFRALEPDAVDRMIARELVPEWPGDAHQLYPDLFVTPKAAEHDYRRLCVVYLITFWPHRPPNPYKKESLMVWGSVRLKSWYLVRFQPAGERQKSRLARVALSKLATARETLEKVLGPLTRYEMLTESEALALKFQAMAEDDMELPQVIQQVLVKAARRTGHDGEGADELIGYLHFLRRKEPKTLANLLEACGFGEVTDVTIEALARQLEQAANALDADNGESQ